MGSAVMLVAARLATILALTAAILSKKRAQPILTSLAGGVTLSVLVASVYFEGAEIVFRVAAPS
ncbi:MAG: hypothetical protein AAGA56_12420 [Myxococcota bacterium]